MVVKGSSKLKEIDNNKLYEIYTRGPCIFTQGLFLGGRNTSEDGYARWYDTWAEVVLASLEALNEK